MGIKVLLVFIGLCVSAAGCAKHPEKNGDVAAIVNGEAIYSSDIEKVMSTAFRRDPMFKTTPDTVRDIVDTIIDKRLMIQEAKHLKLDQTPKFTGTIKSFWEQTLVRDLLDRIDNDIDADIRVSEEEMMEYYSQLSRQKTFMVIKNKDRVLLERLMRVDDPASIKWQDKIGPMKYDEVSSDILVKAFLIPKGEMAVIDGVKNSFLFYAVDDVELDILPYEDIKREIRKNIAEREKRKNFDQWLSGVKSRADIKINEKTIEELKGKHD